MELRKYWTVFRRRWLLVVVPVVIVLAVGLATYNPPPSVYNVGVQFIVGQNPAPVADSADEQRYYNWLTSEYIVNGLTDWVKGGQFATAVSQQLAIQGVNVPPGAIQGGLAADNARSMLTVSLTYGETKTLAAMIDAAIVVLTEQNADALPQLGGRNGRSRPTWPADDQPDSGRHPGPTRFAPARFAGDWGRRRAGLVGRISRSNGS